MADSIINIRPGFRRPFTLTPTPAGAAFENPVIEITDGDSTASIQDDGNGGAKGFLNGDGSIGAKAARITFDGHIGDGEVDVTLDVAWNVSHPNATGGSLSVGDEEAIPVPA